MSKTSYLSHFAPPILVLAILATVTRGELRFCHNGPHRMMDSDCPGGFVFNEAIQPACKYYAKDGNQSGIALGTPTNLCEDSTLRAIENVGDDLGDISQFGYFIWEEEGGLNETLGVFDPSNVCHNECLAEWVDHNTATDEEPMPDDFDPASLSDEDKTFINKVNSEMFIRILMDDDEDDPRKANPKIVTTLPPAIPDPPITNKPPRLAQPLPEQQEGMQNENGTEPDSGNSTAVLGARRGASFASHNKDKNQEAGFSLVATIPYDSTQLNVVKLLAKSMKVVVSSCGPFVNEDFYDQILKGFIFIAKLIEDRLMDLSHDLYKGVAAILDHCIGKKVQDFVLNGTKCAGNEIAEGVFFLKSKKYWPYRLTSRSFRWGKFHPIIDATWTTIDIVQSVCFDSFSSNMMLGHVYHMAMEGLFPAKIRMLWRVNPTLKNQNFWNNLLQTYDLNVTMKNLDACAFGARNTSIFDNPLPRPFYTMEELEKEPPAPPVHEPPKGWNKTIEKYWEHYEKLGGFRKASEDFGKCFQLNENMEEQQDMIAALKTSC